MPLPLVQMVMDHLRQSIRYARHGAQICKPRARDRLGRAEMRQKRLFAACTDAGYFVEGRGREGFRTFRAMGADREAMRLVAQALDEIQNRVIMAQREGSPVGR